MVPDPKRSAEPGSVPQVYLDWNATTPLHPDALAAMVRAAEVGFANPASVHNAGRKARSFIEGAREAVGRLTGFHPRDIVFTSGGTEANNLALWLVFCDAVSHRAEPLPTQSAAKTHRPRSASPLKQSGKPPGTNVHTGARSAASRRPHPDAPAATEAPSKTPAMLVSRIEHPSIVRMAESLAREGVRVVWIDPDPNGVVAAASFARAVEAALAANELDIKLLVLQAVNHETGMIQPVAEVSAIAKSVGALLHVDAVQAVGKLPQSTWTGADMVSIAAHKIRGPKGVGALCTRPGLKVRPILFGGAQERGLRPGTQDPVSCAGFAVAAGRAHTDGPPRYAALTPMRDRLEAALATLGGVHNAGDAPNEAGDRAARAPHVANLSWPGWRGDELCAALDLEGLAVSSGSACSAGTAEPSPVITAMLGTDRASSAVRLSLGEATTEADIDRAIEAFRRVLGRPSHRADR